MQNCKGQPEYLRLKHLLPSNILKQTTPSATKEYRTPESYHTFWTVLCHLETWKTLQITYHIISQVAPSWKPGTKLVQQNKSERKTKKYILTWSPLRPGSPRSPGSPLGPFLPWSHKKNIRNSGIGRDCIHGKVQIREHRSKSVELHRFATGAITVENG